MSDPDCHTEKKFHGKRGAVSLPVTKVISRLKSNIQPAYLYEDGT